MAFKIKTRIKKTHKHKSLLEYIWIFLLVFLMLSETKVLENLSNYIGIVTFSTIVFCAFLELLKSNRYTKKETIFVLLTLLLFFQSVFLTKISIPAEIFFYIFIMRRIKKEQFIKCTLFAMVTVVVTVVILSQFKLIPDTSVQINGRALRTSLGFLYPSRVQTYLMIIVFLWINTNYRRKAHVLGLIIINVFSAFCFLYSDARFPFYIGLIASIISIISILPIQTKRIREGEYIAYLFTLVAPMIPFVLAILYNPRVQLLAKLDSLLTGRLFYSLLAIRNRPLHIFNYFPNIDQNTENHLIYGYLDSGYLNIMYNFGLYLYIILVMFMLAAAYNAKKKNDTQMMITLVFTILYSLWYGQVITLLQYSAPIILCTYYIPWRQKKGYIYTFHEKVKSKDIIAS